MPWMDYLVGLAHKLYKMIIETSEGRNVGEWAKSSELWIIVKRQFGNDLLPQKLLATPLVMDITSLEDAREASVREQIRANGNNLLRFALNTEDRIWDELKVWLNANGLKITNAQRDALNTRLFSKNILDVSDAKKLLSLWRQAAKEGFPYPPLEDVE